MHTATSISVNELWLLIWSKLTWLHIITKNCLEFHSVYVIRSTSINNWLTAQHEILFARVCFVIWSRCVKKKSNSDKAEKKKIIEIDAKEIINREIVLFTVFTMSDYDYEIASFVENVHYSTDPTFVCEIALIHGYAEYDLKPNSYHRSKDIQICRFAERCRRPSQKVKLYGKVMFGLTDVVGIEFADTNATHWKCHIPKTKWIENKESFELKKTNIHYSLKNKIDFPLDWLTN